MKPFIKISIFFSYFLLLSPIMAQINVSGYVSDMPSVSYNDYNNTTLTDNLIHNRLNISWRPDEKISTALEIRNRFFCGETVKATPGYAAYYDNDLGWVDLSFNIADGNNYVLNTTIDRLWFDYSHKKWQVRIGRQRVNWGMSMVWNPNDIFNTYSYFDFDYIEKPGIDGMRFQYYHNYASLTESTFKIDYQNRVSAAIRHRFNKWSYDFQLLAGYYNDEDLVLGGGWAGQIKDAGFYGEMTFLSPVDSESDDVYIISTGGNYTFKNSLFLQAEILYSSNLQNSNVNILSLYRVDASVKYLSITDFTYFTSVSYPLTPLINTSLAYMGFPGVDAAYIGPGIDFSLSDDIYISCIGQWFTGKIIDEKINYLLGFLRFKWNF